MKNIIYLLAIVLFASCETQVDIPLNTSNPKLVIDANILWQKGTSGSTQKIKLTTTTDFYSSVIPVVSGATVIVTNSINTVFTFTEIPNTGEYVCANFEPWINENYTLTIQYAGQNYTATEKLLATPSINSTEQKIVQGFGGDVIQVKFLFQDNGSEVNYYLIGVKSPFDIAPKYRAQKDEFFQGNQMFGFYTDKDLKAGDQLFFTLEGISLRYFNYMEKLVSMSGGTGGSPFATPPATLRGNIVNQTNDTNYPLGYFHLSEIDTRNYTVN
jgi:hypothetical protein